MNNRNMILLDVFEKIDNSKNIETNNILKKQNYNEMHSKESINSYNNINIVDTEINDYEDNNNPYNLALDDEVNNEEPNSIILEERNVVTVVKGGKIRRKRVLCITTDLENSVGLGIAKDENSLLAFYKSKYHSFNNLIKIFITYHRSIPHLIHSKFGAANLVIIPATIGTGIIAPYFLKAFLYCCGINNIITKQFGSSNILNNSIALIKAFKILNRLIWHSKNRSKFLFLHYKKKLK